MRRVVERRSATVGQKLHGPVLGLIGVLALAAAPASARAQVPWESPQMAAPGSPRGASLLFVDFGLSPYDGTGLLLAWRAKDAPHAVGLRIAATMPGSDRMRVSGGIDAALPMFERTAAFPLDVQWTSGIGAGYGDYWSVALPAGATASRTMEGSAVGFAPWMGARVVLEGYFGENAPDQAFAVDVAAEIGTDVWLQRSGAVRLRTALSLGDRRALAIGLHVGRSRAPAVAARQPIGVTTGR